MRVALRGPLFSGKTTTAEALEHEGFHLINFTDSLKAMAASALSHLGVPTSVADIKADKERYRPFLQRLGTLVGFDEGQTIPGLLAEEFSQHGADASYVFDNVRFFGQWKTLQQHGFLLVQLALSPMEQETRASAKGMSHAALGKAMDDPAEVMFPIQPEELVLNATNSVEHNVRAILSYAADMAA